MEVAASARPHLQPCDLQPWTKLSFRCLWRLWSSQTQAWPSPVTIVNKLWLEAREEGGRGSASPDQGAPPAQGLRCHTASHRARHRATHSQEAYTARQRGHMSSGAQPGAHVWVTNPETVLLASPLGAQQFSKFLYFEPQETLCQVLLAPAYPDPRTDITSHSSM
jgi:hypothetical protein